VNLDVVHGGAVCGQQLGLLDLAPETWKPFVLILPQLTRSRKNWEAVPNVEFFGICSLFARANTDTFVFGYLLEVEHNGGSIKKEYAQQVQDHPEWCIV
jgi:hypothetical protein